jgi:uncharacterized protein YbjT (DUF2867 family)
MTRDPDSERARRLRQAGAEVVGGDFDDPSSIVGAVAGADAMFAAGTAHKAGPDGELRHGHNVAEAAAAAGVPHLVYVSGDGAAADTPVPLFHVKWQVERRIRALRLPAAILAPVYLMENLFNPWNVPAIRAGTYPSPVATDRPLQQVAVADVVAFAALTLERPGAFIGRRIPLASAELTGDEAAAAISRVIERTLEAERLDRDVLPPPLRLMFDWLESAGHGADPEGLRRQYPEVAWHGYEQWAGSQRERFRELCPRRELAAH